MQQINLFKPLYTAIIIEPRKHPAMEFVLNNFLENLNESWLIVVVYGNNNINFLNEIIETKLFKYKHRIQTMHLHVDDLNREQYNSVFFNEQFYECIPTETFLVFQTDTMIFRKNRDKINEFLTFDYVGAPWKTTFDCDENGHEMNVGNGGLSLRKKSKMLEMLKFKHLFPLLDKHSCINGEDIFFNGFYTRQHVKTKKPCFEYAKHFSVETVFYKSPFGVHCCWKYLNENEMNDLTEEEPELETLIKLQN